MSNLLQFLLFNYLVICLVIPVTGQDNDTYAREILNNKNDSILKSINDYRLKILKYNESNLLMMNLYERQADSMLNVIDKSTLTQGKQRIFKDLTTLSVNNISNDVYSKVKELDQALAITFNKYISLTSLYDLDRKYYQQTIIKKKFKSWEADIAEFIHNKSIDYYNADKIKVEDAVFFDEVKVYKFNTGDVIADLGAGSGYFEKVLSKYCDNLIVYATDIDSATITRLTTQLTFLELNDKTNITYVPVLGDDKSSHLPFNSFDKVIIRNTFHHFSYPREMLEDCRRIMKKEGKLFIVDILIDEVSKTPQCNFHLTRKVFLNYLKGSGFILINETRLEYDNFKCFEFQLVP